MPQLVKGRKWVFGWVVVGQQGEVRIPPDVQRVQAENAGDPTG